MTQPMTEQKTPTPPGSAPSTPTGSPQQRPEHPGHPGHPKKPAELAPDSAGVSAGSGKLKTPTPTGDTAGNDVSKSNASRTDTSGAISGGASGAGGLVPVTEAIRYRKRAQAAEQQLDEIKGQLQDTRVELSQAKQTVDALDRRAQIDQLLTESDALDLEVASLLTEAAVTMMDEPDIKLAVEDLKRHKPYLFRSKRTGEASPVSPMAGHPPRSNVGRTQRNAADRAAATGDRRDLLRYLRLRRTTGSGR